MNPRTGPVLEAESQGAMNGVTLRRKVVITNPSGFHLRPMAAFAEVALRFQSKVNVTKDAAAVDGKSPLALMGLAAEQGQQLLIEVSGPDAQATLDALMEVFAALATAEEIPEPPAASKD